MAGEETEVRSKGLEAYNTFNKIALTAELGFAAVAAFVAPELVVPALTLAALNVGEIILLNNINKKPRTKDQYALAA